MSTHHRLGCQVAVAVLTALLLSSSAGAATVDVRYPTSGDGFSSSAPRDTASPAPGATLGEQRRASFEAAAGEWASRLTSNVTITIDAEMLALSCNSLGAILGAAGPATVSMNWDGVAGGSPSPFADTWYHAALANKIANVDLDTSSDVVATFNRLIDNNNGCLNGINWHYGMDTSPAPAGTISFFTTVLHEIGHGIGVSTFVNPSTGAAFFDSNDIYMRFLEDSSRGLTWDQLSAADRAESAVDTGDLVWAGPAVTAAAGALTAGTTNGRARMFAPRPVQPGSSISHFDTAVSAGGIDELMEPFATGSEGMLLVEELLEDIGWGDTAGPGLRCGDGLRQGIEECDDGNTRSGDCCSPTCVIDPVGASCDDGNACTTGDTCSAGSCVAGTPIQCDDGNLCTDDGCSPSTGCSSTANTATCDDGDVCTTGDTCSAGICTGILDDGCNNGTPCPECSDGNPCTEDLCLPGGGCSNPHNSAPCDDGDACTSGDVCAGGACNGARIPGCGEGDPCGECSDGNPCTDDLCLPGGGCSNPPSSGPCEDGNRCTSEDVCVDGVCTAGRPTGCNDANPCTDDTCDPRDGCRSRVNSIACDDGDLCTTGDTCAGGACRGDIPASCDDGNPCTEDSCNALGGCLHVPNAAVCDDGNGCTSGDRCSAGTCAGVARACDDGDDCTSDDCDPVTGSCTTAARAALCDDGNPCTGDDACTDDGCRGVYLVDECCGDANFDGDIAATDTLIILNFSVGQDVTCPMELCDVDASGAVTASDALFVLRDAIGVDTELDCRLPDSSRRAQSPTSTTSTTVPLQ